jgi:hypothetical protein
VSAALEAQVARGLTQASGRISSEVRTELASGLAGAERTLDERAATRIADHTSRLIEQAAKSSASLSERAAELATESRKAAEQIAKAVAGEESNRLYGELGSQLQARIDAAEKASAEEVGRARSELEDVNADAAQRRLDEALERVRADGAAQLEAQKEGFAAEVDATIAKGRSELGALAEDLEKREQRRELKLAKAETSRRVQRVISKLEQEHGKVESEREAAVQKMRAEVEEATAEAKTRIDESAKDAGREVGGVGERLSDALRRVDATVAEVEESTGRISELERRASVKEREAARSAEMARNAVELEARMREALNMEAAAAEQITIAERRLIDFVVHR